MWVKIWKRRNTCTLGGNVNYSSAIYGEQHREVPRQQQKLTKQQKLRLDLSYDLSISLLGIYPKAIKSAFQRDICKSILTVALFTIAKP